ncbi:unnamed protein product [Lampetra planeri]
MNIYSVTLIGPAPWGFRLQGGKDFSMPPHRFEGGKAAQAGVAMGDWVVSIDGVNAEDMTHVEAQNKIRAITDSLTLTLSNMNTQFEDGGQPLPEGKKLLMTAIIYSPYFHVVSEALNSTTAKVPRMPHRFVFPADSSAAASVQPKYSFAPSAAINKMARPFAAGGGSANSGPVIKPVAYSPKLNTPRSQGHASTASGVENMPCFIPNDRSKKRLIQDTEDWQPRTGTTQSRSFRILAQLTGTDFMQDPDDENMKRAREKFLTEIQSPRYARLRDWHHDRSARALNIKS